MTALSAGILLSLSNRQGTPYPDLLDSPVSGHPGVPSRDLNIGPPDVYIRTPVAECCRRGLDDVYSRGQIIHSAPSLGVYYFFVVDSVCMSVCLSRSFKSILLLLFLDGIEPFFGLQFSMWHSTKRFLRFLI